MADTEESAWGGGRGGAVTLCYSCASVYIMIGRVGGRESGLFLHEGVTLRVSLHAEKII